MPIVVPIIYDDNYSYLCPTAPGHCLIIDPGEAGPVLRSIQETGLKPEAIFLTHGHADHTGGVRELLQHHPGTTVYATTGNATIVDEGDSLPCLDSRILTTPGHSPDSACLLTPYGLFTGDTLFGGGCGRVFTGDYSALYDSLCRIAALEPDTTLYFGHEYTLNNLKFAAEVEPKNSRIEDYRKMVQRRGTSVPGILSRELMTNPFLRCHEPTIISYAQKKEPAVSSPLVVFTLLRKEKDKF